MSKMRQSNFELLRILAAVLVLISHADYISIGEPGIADAQSDFICTFWRVFWEQFSMVAVDVFVLISGWFGIRSSTKGFLKFIFPAVLIPVFILLAKAGLHQDVSMKEMLESLYFGGVYWFISAYAILYVTAPLLNTFIEKGSRKEHGAFLLSFMLVQFVYGWLSFDYARFFSGYSGVSFIGLYFLARYVRIYGTRILEKTTFVMLFSSFLLFTLLASLCVCASLRFQIPVISEVICRKFIAYNSPFIVIPALLLLLAFSRLSFGSRVINYVAPASFTVYLINANPVVLPKYCEFCSDLYNNYGGVAYLLRICLIISLFLVVSLAINRIISWLWKPVDKAFR